jgi:signal transduction histidine kinase
MELIFRAAELESTPPAAKSVQLIPFPLEEVFEQSIPRWQKQAERRNVELDVILPKQLPKVVSDPTMLDCALTGLMESCTRSLPHGGHIRVRVSTAGNQLKLQVLSQCTASTNPLKSLGQLLMFQPETGCLSLNLNVTKNIFQALGGKLTIRQRPQQGEELTIFLPIKTSRLKIHNGNG